MIMRQLISWIIPTCNFRCWPLSSTICKLNKWVKGAVCRMLTLLKHKHTICLQIFKKHAKLTCLSEKQGYTQLFSFENVYSDPECLCLLWFVKPARQFTQLYCGTPGCQLAENTAFLIARSLIWQPVSIKSEEEVLGEKKLQYFEFGLQYLVQPLGVNPTYSTFKGTWF